MNDSGPKIVIYSQAFCGYCAAAHKLLKSKGVSYEDRDVTLDTGLRREMIERSGRSTVPQIFIGDEHIGGYDDMAALDQSGRLDKLLGAG